jgi:hypothetical protein
MFRQGFLGKGTSGSGDNAIPDLAVCSMDETRYAVFPVASCGRVGLKPAQN